MIELDDDVAAIHLLHDAAHQRADLVRVLLEDALALRLAHALDEHLLGGLDGVAAELGDRQREGEHVADLGVGLWARASSSVSWSAGSSTVSTTVFCSATVMRAGVVGEASPATSAVAPSFLRTALASPASSVSTSICRSTLFLARDLTQRVQDLVVHRSPHPVACRLHRADAPMDRSTRWASLTSAHSNQNLVAFVGCGPRPGRRGGASSSPS